MAVISKDEIVIDLKVENQQAIDNLSGKLESLNKKSGATKGKFVDMGAGISSASDKIRNKIVQAFPEAEGAINRASSAFSGLKSAGENGAKGFFSLGNALKLLGGGVIGIVVTAIGALVSYLSKLDPVMDRIEQLVGGASAAFFTFGQRVADFVGGLGKIFSGDVRAGIDQVKNSVLGLGDALVDSAKRGAALVSRLQEIQDFEDISNVQIAENETKIAGLRAKFRKQDLDGKEQTSKIIRDLDNENLRIEKAQLEQRTNHIIQALSNQGVILTKAEKDKLRSLSKSGADLLQTELLNNDKRSKFDKKYYEEYLQLVEKKNQAERKSTSNQSRFEQELEDIKLKRIEASNKAQEEADKVAKKKEEDRLTYLKALRELDAQGLEDGLDKQILIIVNKGKEQKEAIAKLEISEADKKKAFVLIDENVKKEIVETTDEYLQNLEKLRKARKEELDKMAVDKLPSIADSKTQKENKNALEQARKLATKYNKDLQDIKEAEKQGKLDLQEESQKLLTQSINIQDQILQATLDRIDAEVNAQEEKVNRLRDLAEYGSAESLEIEEQRLNRLQEKREQAVQDQKKLAAIQIAINNALSASEAIKVVLDSASTDPTGGILTAVRVASILALIGSTVLTLNSAFSSLPAFKEGTDYVQGAGTETSDSITARLSKGERVVNAYQNKDLRSMGIITNKDLVEYAKLGKSVSDVKIEVPGRGKDYTENFNELVRENRMMRKKLERLEIHMGISNEGIYGMITSMEEKQNKINKLKA